MSAGCFSLKHRSLWKAKMLIFQDHNYKWVLLGIFCALVSQRAKKKRQDKHQGKSVSLTNKVFILNCFLQLY